MPSALTAVLLASAAVVVLGLAAFYLRLRTLGSRVGSFECALSTPTGWSSGIAHYGVDQLRWYRVVSLSPRPSHSWPRSAIVVTTRAVRDPDAATGPSAILEITCDVDGQEIRLAMRAAPYSGLASWLESQPPREAHL